MIKLYERPKETMCRIFKCEIQDLEGTPEYTMFVDIVNAYQKQGGEANWDEYRTKAKVSDILPQMTEVMTECKRNGFMAPRVDYSGKLYWQQIVSNSKDVHTLDKCTLCLRDCVRREMINDGTNKWKRQNEDFYVEPKACWDKSR